MINILNDYFLEQDLVFQIFAVYITEVPFRKYSPKAAFNYYSSDYMNSDGKTVKGGDGSLNPNDTYTGWQWILARNKGGKWKHKDHGYG